MSVFIRILLLYLRAHHAWPWYGETLHQAVIEAVDQEGADVPAELLVTIAQHESDFEPAAVSWRSHGMRTDLIWDPDLGRQPPDRPSTCGYLQAMSPDRATCANIIADHGGMPAGAQELREWSRMCHGDLGCVARGHAGGSACAKSRRACSKAARKISDHFVRATRSLQR
jgi:hypothetical protein